MYYSKRGTSLAAKLAARSQRDVHGCLLWLGALDDDGYGHVFDGANHLRVHVAAWKFKHGPVPEGRRVCHTCDVRNCFEDTHLWLGTQRQNIADMDAKGRRRSARGIRNGNATLTDSVVRAIREAPGKHRNLAVLFGTSKSTVTGVKNRQRWRHVQ